MYHGCVTNDAILKYEPMFQMTFSNWNNYNFLKTFLKIRVLIWVANVESPQQRTATLNHIGKIYMMKFSQSPVGSLEGVVEGL